MDVLGCKEATAMTLKASNENNEKGTR